MNDKKDRDFYQSADEIVRQIRDYSNKNIEDGLADIHKRVQNVIKYNHEEEDKKKGNPLYYRISNIETIHTETSEAYFNFTQANDLAVKATIIGKISTMNNILINLEKRGEDDE